jgi:hypothetical protein
MIDLYLKKVFSRSGANAPHLRATCQKTTYRRYQKWAFFFLPQNVMRRSRGVHFSVQGQLDRGRTIERQCRLRGVDPKQEMSDSPHAQALSVSSNRRWKRAQDKRKCPPSLCVSCVLAKRRQRLRTSTVAWSPARE